MCTFLSFCSYTLMSLFSLSLCSASFHFFAAHLPLCLFLIPPGKFPSLCNSHFASFSCSVLSAWLFPLFLFESRLSRDEKLIFVSPCLPFPSHSVHQPVYLTAFSHLLSLPPLTSILNQAEEQPGTFQTKC